MEIATRNVNQAFSDVFWRMKAENLIPEMSRNGPVLAFPEPVIITYKYPQERVLFHEGRDANVIFHILESIWMLAGRRDVAFLQLFNSRIGQYSDDGENFNAAYGYRWRHHFGQDQLVNVIETLRADPTSRQAVIQMWDAADLTRPTKDKACNTQLVFDCRGGRLNMAVFNRSNDIYWGALGANAVHFSFLQEFVAHALQLRMGVYRQISVNLHLYLELYDASKYVRNPPDAAEFDFYSNGQVRPHPIMLNDDYVGFINDCEVFCRDPFDGDYEYTHSFFNTVAHPLAMISKTRRGHSGDGRSWADRVAAEDVKRAAQQWIARRERLKAA